MVSHRIEELKERIPVGGPREAAIRALLYIRMPDGVVDERGFNLLRRMREEAGKGLPLSDFKQLVREQFLMLLIDERRAVEAIPSMLNGDSALAARLSGNLGRMIEVVGVQSRASRSRLAEIEALLASVGRNGTSKTTALENPPPDIVPPPRVHTARSSKHH